MDRLIGAIGLALFGVMFLVPALKVPSDGTGVWAVTRVVFIFFGFVLLFYAAAITAEVLIDRIGGLMFNYAERAKRLTVITPETERLRLFGALTTEQLTVMLKQQAAIVAVPQIAGAIAYYDIDGTLITADFVNEFLDLCDEHELVPVRTWSDSIQREWAQTITAFCINRGLANPAVGNQSATWRVPFADAAGWFSLIYND